MKRSIYIIILSVLIIAIGTETFILINNNNKIATLNNKISQIKNNKDEELAKKVIIETYKQFEEAGKLRHTDDMYLFNIMDIKDNINLISDSYIGIDNDIKEMLSKFKIHINYINDNEIKVKDMKKDEQTSYYLKSAKYYMETDKIVKKCISKYALFDKVGLR